MADIDVKQIAELCIKHHHEQVIEKQKEAISELRKYVSEMEELTVNMSLPQVATHKILKLQISNEELKKKLAAEILSAQINYLDKSEDQLFQEVCHLKELLKAAHDQIQVEENYRRHCQEALDASEDLFLKCMKAINSELDIKKTMGSNPISYIDDSGTKENILNERGKGFEVIVNNIKSMKHQMQRKDGLLQSYEDDSRKLSKSRSDTLRQSKEIDEMKVELDAYKDEVNYLQESLKNSQSSDMVSMEFLVEAIDKKKINNVVPPPRKLARERITPNLKKAKNLKPFRY